MRLVTLTAAAVFCASTALSAYAQTATPAAPAPAKMATAMKSPCKGLDEASCQAPTCMWMPSSMDKKGKEKKASCKKMAKAKKMMKAAEAPK